MSPTRASLKREPPVLVRPYSSAVLVALIYVAVSAIYIIVSGQIAADAALTAEQLQAIEQIKGIGFVVVTGILLFVSFRGFATRSYSSINTCGSFRCRAMS